MVVIRFEIKLNERNELEGSKKELYIVENLYMWKEKVGIYPK